MSELSELQMQFSEKIVQLECFILSNGWRFTDGDAYRDERVHGKFGVSGGYGSKNSVHKLRLARDINLRINNKYVKDGSCDEYKLLGAYWEASHPLARWGGRFNDANHFSFEYNGFK